ncbi:alpha/beta hydrolase family protein [Pseudooceanicola onchidii]|uniref:alpha/beta hydrolase family protein n=1 Tax=Pseudooceanicola onchidii TaxID=2562279 RepID=UPI001F10601B|nr:alpha/beta fold hydrolase [Pseudooceanicola onchidii]
MNRLLRAAAAASLVASPLMAENRIDMQRPDAPELAAPGDHVIGVRTMTFTDPGRVDVVNATAEGDLPTYDRAITVEVWYPAAEGTTPGGTYQTVLRDGETETTLTGQAARDAAPAEGSFPLILISHGYPGNRMLMSHLGENLATKGYVVVSADHRDSTYSDQNKFTSTLVNRPIDQRFVIDSMTALDDEVGQIVDDANIGVVGYSMGGYGALIFGGGGLSQLAVTRTEPAFAVAPQNLLAQNATGSAELDALVDDRVKAIVAIGPWGRNYGFFDAESLKGLEKPLMLVAGSQDDVSQYPAIRQIFEETTGVDRYLLTFMSANHNAAAPMPAPAESYAVSEKLGYAPFDHYADAVWDTVRMNNILQHFVTAFMDANVKGDADKAAYYDGLVETAEEGVASRDDAGAEKPDHSYWKGFADRTAKGLKMEKMSAE